MDIARWTVDPWINVLFVLLCWILILSVVRKIVFVIVRKLAARTKNTIDDLFLDALDFPARVLVYASGMLVILRWLPVVPGVDVQKYLLDGCKILCIGAGVLFIDKFLQGLMHQAGEKVEILRTSGGVAQGFVRIVVLGLGALILMDTFGVSITPLIASLGIGSLAVALALQPTLENFFSGIQLIADKPIQVGQFVKLESGEEGTVARIGWRSTWITMPTNNTVVIPNKTLVNTRVTNYFYPDAEIVFSVILGVPFVSDLDKVERVTIDAARLIMKECPGGVPGFDPVVRFNALGDFSVGFSVSLRAKDWPSTHLVRHEFIKRLLKSYALENIVIPYPTRMIVKEQ